MEYKIILVLALIVIILSVILLKARKNIRELKFSKRSISSKYGKMSEQFMPFLSDYPYDPQNFRFLGSPIDGVQFEDDRIIFIEFKTSRSQLSFKQKNIRDIIDKGKIIFEEHRLDV